MLKDRQRLGRGGTGVGPGKVEAWGGRRRPCGRLPAYIYSPTSSGGSDGVQGFVCQKVAARGRFCMGNVNLARLPYQNWAVNSSAGGARRGLGRFENPAANCRTRPPTAEPPAQPRVAASPAPPPTAEPGRRR
jgi:hypothetical protein